MRKKSGPEDDDGPSRGDSRRTPTSRPAEGAGPSKGKTPDPCDVRCMCGSLVARRVGRSIELKCRRCRRRILISWEHEGPVVVYN